MNTNVNVNHVSNDIELVEIYFGYLSKDSSKDGGKDGGKDCINSMPQRNENNKFEYLL
jgi:hypothetical protein